jgi:hypothetical protein
MEFAVLTEQNYVMYAMKHYQNSQCTGIEEFHDDLNRTKYLKRLFRKYKQTGILKERLILNHIIIFYNVFPIVPATRILFHKTDEDSYSLLKTFLVYLNTLPEEEIPEVDLVEIPLVPRVVQELRSI